ncbi:hypothetical protein, partial [Cloacibacillus evryensis]
GRMPAALYLFPHLLYGAAECAEIRGLPSAARPEFAIYFRTRSAADQENSSGSSIFHSGLY